MPQINPLSGPYQRMSLAMLTGILLACLSVFAGILLVGISGWFITATAITGLGLLSLQGYNLFLPSAIIRLLALSRPPIKYYEKLYNHQLTFKLAAATRVWLFKGLFKLDRQTLIQFRDIEFSSKMSTDINQLEELLTGLIIPWLSALVGFSCAIIYFFYIWPLAALILILIYLICGLLIPYFSMKSAIRAQHARKTQKKLAVVLSDYLNGYKEITSFGLQESYKAESRHLIQDIAAQHQQEMQSKGVDGLLQAFVLEIGLVGMLVLACFVKNQPDGPLLVLAMLVIISLFELISPLAELFYAQGSTVSIAEDLKQFATSGAEREEVLPTALSLNYKFRVTNLSFGYGKRILYKDLNLCFPARSTTAIRGANGSGKSTLLDLLYGFHVPDSGEVTLDGRDIRTRENFTTEVCYMEQHSLLFNESIFENIRLGKPDASVAAVEQAAIAAGLQGHLLQFELGIMTKVAEGAKNISGGQQRMISLARLILKDSPVMVLDEPTEGMDVQASLNLARLINSWHGIKTIILVSHHTAMDIRIDRYYQLP
jgi:ATP-binding cassette subfamily C protein CydC